MSRPLVCPYLTPRYMPILIEYGMEPHEVDQVWRDRRWAALEAGYVPHHSNRNPKRAFIAAGVDNPFSTHDAWRLMLGIALRGLIK